MRRFTMNELLKETQVNTHKNSLVGRKKEQNLFYLILTVYNQSIWCNGEWLLWSWESLDKESICIEKESPKNHIEVTKFCYSTITHYIKTTDSL